MEVAVGASAGGDLSISSCLSRLAVGVHWVGDSVGPRVCLELTETCELSVSVEQEALLVSRYGAKAGAPASA